MFTLLFVFAVDLVACCSVVCRVLCVFVVFRLLVVCFVPCIVARCRVCLLRFPFVHVYRFHLVLNAQTSVTQPLLAGQMGVPQYMPQMASAPDFQQQQYPQQHTNTTKRQTTTNQNKSITTDQHETKNNRHWARTPIARVY